MDAFSISDLSASRTSNFWTRPSFKKLFRVGPSSPNDNIWRITREGFFTDEMPFLLKQWRKQRPLFVCNIALVYQQHLRQFVSHPRYCPHSRSSIFISPPLPSSTNPSIFHRRDYLQSLIDSPTSSRFPVFTIFGFIRAAEGGVT